MVWLLGKILHRCRNGVALFLYALVIVQSIGLAHVADQTLHADHAVCRICDAIGHAAIPPTPAMAPAAPTLPIIAAFVVALRWLEIPPTFSSHVPRAPPSAR